MTIRPATPADIAAMMDLERHAVTAAHWRREHYERILQPGSDRTGLVVEDDGGICGFVIGRALGEEWELENIAVAGPARRRGLATRLVGELLDRARRAGARSVFLEVRESNHAARALYEKWAFLESGRRKGYYTDPPEDALVCRFSFPEFPQPAGKND